MLRIWTKTKWGKIAGILWIGERYYLIKGKLGVSLMPASVVEEKRKVRDNE